MDCSLYVPMVHAVLVSDEESEVLSRSQQRFVRPPNLDLAFCNPVRCCVLNDSVLLSWLARFQVFQLKRPQLPDVIAAAAAANVGIGKAGYRPAGIHPQSGPANKPNKHSVNKGKVAGVHPLCHFCR